MKLALQTLLTMTCVVASVPAFAQADGFPARPTRMIVPWPPGGSVDPFARLLSHKLPEFMGQQVVVDYRPGASGNLGMELAARSRRSTGGELGAWRWRRGSGGGGVEVPVWNRRRAAGGVQLAACSWLRGASMELPTWNCRRGTGGVEVAADVDLPTWNRRRGGGGVEVAARNQLLRARGQHAARVLAERLERTLREGSVTEAPDLDEEELEPGGER